LENAGEPIHPMSHVSENTGASAPGVAFAYETAKWQIEKQEASLREVNSRLAFLIAGLLGVSTYYFKELDPKKNPIETLIFGVALGLPIILAGFGYVPRGYSRPPNPRGVAEEAFSEPGAIREKVLGTMLAAFELNNKVLRRKSALFAMALIVALLGWLVGIGYKVYAASREMVSERISVHEPRRDPDCRIKATAVVIRDGGGFKIQTICARRALHAQGTIIPKRPVGGSTSAPVAGRTRPAR
jgi:hypothetical protein